MGFTVVAFSVAFRLICYLFLQQLLTSKKGITAGKWGIHIFGAVQIYGIHIMVSIFSSINGASRILNFNLILMMLNWFC